ncbi:putative metal-binding motif-containing protein [Myxococcus sp. K38C18041901]|uniref:putative metal-binding motif-containing protein n=1 Tax=Myxococcus guangdongensis TaxID=2906760 RepID=UPI0020A81CB4|nr:putative metal-binding motif-containing protein [Myxococcus guangdongensis]MCP3061561.1 putative metal-binding motif-containing protein [Myxococcus guangdongensis]
MVRLFLVGVALLTLSMAGCKSKTSTNEGGFRVFITYATFRPKCLTLSVEDRREPTRRESGVVTVDADARSDTRVGVILKQAGWSQDLRVIAQAHEGSCEGPVIARQSADVQLPEENLTDLKLDLRAEDLDDDGFFAMKGDYPGTDCDDTRPEVHPGATEVCDGVDNNCVAGESDAPGNVQYWVDEDGDGYGDATTQPQMGCAAPVGFATRAGDCNDNDPLVHPGQDEFRCDGKDDNCDGAADNAPFDVGVTCVTEQLCAGTRQCQSTQASACVSTQVPVEYFADDDGDGQAGTSLGLSCQAPELGATTEKNDCDEGTPRVSFVGVAEVCDRLDNDCVNGVDDGVPGCAAVAWNAVTVLNNGSTRYDAVANYGERLGWLAGPNDRVVHVNGNTFTAATSCAGDWKSAWAAPNGRVFLGSSDGRFATLMPNALTTPCETRSSGQTGAINGLVGFPDPNSNVFNVYGVSSTGRVVSWSYDHGSSGNQPDPTTVTQFAANLRDIDGLRADSLFVVGAETVNGEQRPVAWSSPESGTTWTREVLGLPETTTGFLNGVQVLTPQMVYVAGDRGLLLEKSRATWTQKPVLTVTGGVVPNLRAFIAFGRTGIYAASSVVNDLHFFNGTAWSTVATPTRTVNALGGFGPGEVWATGHDGLLTRWKP